MSQLVDSKKVGPSKNEWRTPPALVKAIEDHFKIKFTLDPCAAPGNHLGIKNFYTKAANCDAHPWFGVVWVNPPYDEKWAWVRKAWLESVKRNADVWVLLESCTDTVQFHNWAHQGEVYLLRGRIKFLGDDLKPIGNGFRGSILFHFKKKICTRLPRIQLLDLTLFNEGREEAEN